jgi:DMSO/TMAO reductase YedYZ molybdopterin-dependent catalytic subunit
MAAFAAARSSAQVTTGNPAQRTPAECTTVPDTPTFERPKPQQASHVFSAVETELAFRNHGTHAEFLHKPLTPLGSHYLLIHFDAPWLDSDGYSLSIGGRVGKPFRIGLDELKKLPPLTQAVTMECAGTGRSTLHPRGVYVPWFKGCIGTYQWTGTRLRPLLERAGLLDGAVEVLFTGWDTGVDLGVEHAFERSIPIADALRDEVMLAWAANDQPLLREHGFPLRLIVPSWYGMASVKWLRAITVLNKPFEGIHQTRGYRYSQSGDDPGTPVRSKWVNSMMAPPGIPDMISRHRFVAPGKQVLEGKAWSGFGRVTSVEVSTDGGATWGRAELKPVSGDPFAWVHWRFSWNAAVGEHMLACRASDDAGNRQPLDPNERYNVQANGVNGVQRVPVTVQAGIGTAGQEVPSRPRGVMTGAEVPKPPQAFDKPEPR